MGREVLGGVETDRQMALRTMSTTLRRMQFAMPRAKQMIMVRMPSLVARGWLACCSAPYFLPYRRRRVVLWSPSSWAHHHRRGIRRIAGTRTRKQEQAHH